MWSDIMRIEDCYQLCKPNTAITQLCFQSQCNTLGIGGSSRAELVRNIRRLLPINHQINPQIYHTMALRAIDRGVRYVMLVNYNN